MKTNYGAVEMIIICRFHAFYCSLWQRTLNLRPWFVFIHFPLQRCTPKWTCDHGIEIFSCFAKNPLVSQRLNKIWYWKGLDGLGGQDNGKNMIMQSHHRTIGTECSSGTRSRRLQYLRLVQHFFDFFARRNVSGETSNPNRYVAEIIAWRTTLACHPFTATEQPGNTEYSIILWSKWNII